MDIESPYSASLVKDVARNVRYARACVRDSLLRGEVPFASHLFYTQAGILDDNLPKERDEGIKAGKALIERLNAVTVVYTDLGISEGMRLGIRLAESDGRRIEYRSLGRGWERAFLTRERAHSHRGVW